MMRNLDLGLILSSAALLLAVAACSSDDDGGSGPGGSGGTAGTGGTAGQAGQAGSGGTSGSGGTAGSTGGSGGEEDAGVDASTGIAGDHLLISEVGILADDAEFIEIWNPTGQPVDLSNYYLSDNSAYYTITNGPWNPDQTPGTDFVAQFPPGTTIPADGAIVIGANPLGYEAVFAGCPDLFLTSDGQPVSCGGGDVPSMLVPANGSVGDQAGALLSNGREMIVLFTWDGSSTAVKDVDYVTWGADFTDSSRVDKSGVTGYQNDTPRGSQSSANATFPLEGGAPEAGPGAARSIERCDAQEPGETLAGGNGSTGHDETSEDFSVSFSTQEVPTPGAKNSCL